MHGIVASAIGSWSTGSFTVLSNRRSTSGVVLLNDGQQGGDGMSAHDSSPRAHTASGGRAAAPPRAAESPRGPAARNADAPGALGADSPGGPAPASDHSPRGAEAPREKRFV